MTEGAEMDRLELAARAVCCGDRCSMENVGCKCTALEDEGNDVRAVLEQVAAWLENYGPGCSRSFRRDFGLDP